MVLQSVVNEHVFNQYEWTKSILTTNYVEHLTKTNNIKTNKYLCTV